MTAIKQAEAGGLRRLLVAVLVAPLGFYQRFISPGLPRRCKYHPTCSDYAVTAIRRHGALRGSGLAVWRLARCNPFSHGGYDPVPSSEPVRKPRSPAPSAKS